MPSTLVSGYHPHTDDHHQLPQLRDFNWDWDKVKSRAAQCGEQTRELTSQTTRCFVPSPHHKINDFTPAASSMRVGEHVDPAAAPSNTLPYPTPHTHSRQGSKNQPFYQRYHSARQNQSPPKKKVDPIEREESVRRRASTDGNSIASYLQIPESINNSKGSLPEFAAQITCLFWFESSQTLQLAQEPRSLSNTVVASLSADATPTTGFRKWVTTILSMTQVTPNVILLALMFIYRLKKLNPGVKGKVGSEFRLLTVALMLGNKFLDDNTYTNKTWAEVSGISVQEIHVMEVEFLSNMRYSLFSSVEEWDAWQVKLGRFADYFDRAAEATTRALSSATSLQLLSRAPNVPSPPASVHTSPPLGRPSPGHSALPQPHSMPSMLTPAMSLPASLPPPEMDPTKQWSRKRSLEDNQLEGPSKRASSFTPSAASSSTVAPSIVGQSNSSLPKLPMPNILSLNQHNAHGGQNLPSAQLPPSSSRAMSTVFPGSRWPQNMTLPALQPSQHFGHQGSSGTSSPVNGLPNRPSPYGHTSGTSSPTSYAFPQPSHTPAGLSPSGMPLARHSPYKPVRGVHTLLVPPPSAAVHHAPQQLSYNQMHYQPLGQPKTERRTGVLPYLPFETWSQSHNMQHYLPQPNFST